MVSLVGIGYCLGSCWKKDSYQEVTPKHVVKKVNPTVHHVVKTPVKKQIKPVQRPKQEKKPPKPVVQKRVEKSKVTTPKSHVKHTKLAYRSSIPKLVIIIDDVHTQAQLNAIMQLGIPVTPSIFPPYSLDKKTPKLATHAVHYMVHLPMESGNAKFDRQSKTLMTHFSKAQMEARMHELRRLFPRAHYINNHTGSKFTENKDAMKRLYGAMRKEGFSFIDSRTTGRSKVGKIAHVYGDDYVARDIFIDNVKSVSAIHAQLRKAVRLAKKHGYAIAIGHPSRVTMQALRSAKPLLKEVEVVYVDEIFREE
jgi:polysaccharide deacetylase 2 family uncharacterized protein YibQ